MLKDKFSLSQVLVVMSLFMTGMPDFLMSITTGLSIWQMQILRGLTTAVLGEAKVSPTHSTEKIFAALYAYYGVPFPVDLKADLRNRIDTYMNEVEQARDNFTSEEVLKVVKDASDGSRDLASQPPLPRPQLRRTGTH